MAPRPFQVDPVLTAIAVGYSNPAVALIADRVLPRIDVAAKFSWLQFSQADSFTVPNSRVGRRGRVERVEFSATELNDAVQDYGLEDSIPQTDIDDAAAQRAAGLSVYDPQSRATMGLTDLIALDREIRVANKVFALGTYDASRRITLSGTSQFTDYTNSDPVGLINAGLDATLMARPNKAVLSQYGWSKLRAHPRIVKSVKGGISGDGMVTREQFAELFELDEVLVGQGQANTAKKGQALSLSRVWGKHLALLHINPQGSVGSGQPTFGFTGNCGGKVAMVMDDPNVGLKGGTTVRVGERLREVVSAPSVGYFLENAFA